MSNPLETKEQLEDLLDRSNIYGGGEHISPNVSNEVLQKGKKINGLLDGLNINADNKPPTKKQLGTKKN